ncbi:sure-like protein [Sistotremastrum niveocremeum HHB9708]|uniref:Sure-like protein n=1 Tax=Sistotremastrum niveocremeum HHB9708 TaxID=1314777 RepID=A0A164YDP0_9AGAM|nr:sure-like protein [Sistotremastrum niveocremeum HHB9708]
MLFDLGASIFSLFFLLAGAACESPKVRVVLTNDDGWAEANIRAQYTTLTEGGYEVVLSAPAQDQSGTGSLDLPPTPLLEPCEYNTCVIGSPATGYNASEPQLNYVNSFPVTSVKFGIQTLAPKFFSGSPPDIVVSGPNVGANTGISVLGSGTVGAACEAAKEDIPAIAFSGTAKTRHSYTELVAGDSSFIYSSLALSLIDILIATPKPFLPPNTILNVNFPNVTAQCASEGNFEFVLSRAFPTLIPGFDLNICNTNTLPTESSVVGNSDGCFASISVLDARTKLDAGKSAQTFVYSKLGPLLKCLS